MSHMKIQKIQNYKNGSHVLKKVFPYVDIAATPDLSKPNIHDRGISRDKFLNIMSSSSLRTQD